MTCAYYNEHEPYAAQWLRNLIGHPVAVWRRPGVCRARSPMSEPWAEWIKTRATTLSRRSVVE